MDEFSRDIVLNATGAKNIIREDIVQSLWSGYGKIIRCKLRGGTTESVIVKKIHLEEGKTHPRGWNTNLSHERKLKSYRVEVKWYKNYSKLSNEKCRLPLCFAVELKNDEVLIVLEDLNEAGFALRKTSVTLSELKSCLSWLANFHAVYMNINPEELWNVGTYWHLETRPEELEALNDIELKKAANAIDNMLNSTPYKTIVHGDAKLANFCFSNSGKGVAAVDFQYVGGGCGMKDVAYFIGSCLYEDDCEKFEQELLNFYFNELRKSFKYLDIKDDYNALEENWRKLYPVAWTDFHRFIKGWSPGHWKINSYSERLSREVIKYVINENN